MKRIFLLVFFGLLLFLIFFPKKTYASFACSVSPSSINNGGTITIDTNGNLANNKDLTYYVSLNGNFIRTNTIRYSVPIPYSASSGKVTAAVPSTFGNGAYKVGLFLSSDTGNNLCNNSPVFTIGSAGSGSGGTSCNISFLNQSFTPTNNIIIKMTGPLASGNPDDQLHTYIRINDNNGGSVWDGCVTRRDLTNSTGFGFVPLSTGRYYMQINDGCTPAHLLEKQACYATFYVDTYGGGVNSAGNPQDQSPPSPCHLGSTVKGSCTAVDTALGTLGTEPQSLITSLFGLILSLSGGVALLLIIISGYRLLVSQGNPEAIKGAREQLTAAIVGLLFIIFSLVILEIIGVNILHIPGFG